MVHIIICHQKCGSLKEEKYDYKTDIFSLGALIIEIVNGESPFYDEYRCRFKNVYKNLDKCLNNSTDRYYEKKYLIIFGILMKNGIYLGNYL